MTSNKSYECEELIQNGKPLNFRMTHDNPLAYLSGKKGFQAVSENKRSAAMRLLGNDELTMKLRTIYRSSAPVLTEEFSVKLMQILNSEIPLVKPNSNPPQRIKSGTLETNWKSLDIPLTKHHIIPSTRGGENNTRNYLWLPRDIHDDFHIVFGIMTPIEQMAYLMLMYYEGVDLDFLHQMSNLLLRNNSGKNVGQDIFYRNELLKYTKIVYV